eukprot:14065882-Alexandrium_andersonii.AAC.1
MSWTGLKSVFSAPTKPFSMHHCGKYSIKPCLLKMSRPARRSGRGGSCLACSIRSPGRGGRTPG